MNKIIQNEIFPNEENNTPTKIYRSNLKEQKTAQKSTVQMMQLEYKSVINGYELKFRTMTQEHKRSKQELQNKIMALCKEKNYYQIIVQGLNGNYKQIKNNQNTSNNLKFKHLEDVVSSTQKQLSLANQNIQELNNIISTLKLTIDNLKNENSIQKKKLSEIERNITKDQSKEKMIRQKSRSHHSPHHQHHHQHHFRKYEYIHRIQQLQKEKLQSQKQFMELERTLSKTNEAIMKQKVSNLNAKYKNKY